MEKIYIIMIFIFFSLINITSNHKCGTNAKIIPKKVKETFIKRNKTLTKRRIDEDKFNIYLELTNIEEEIKLNKLNEFHDIIINSLKKAAETLTSLLKPIYQGCYQFNDSFVEDYGYYHWNKKQFGFNNTNKIFYTCDYDIDLLIFSRFMNENDEKKYINADILAKSYYVRSLNGQPIIGGVVLNKTLLSNSKNLFEYLKYFFLHSFTHILGFDEYIIKNYLNDKIQIFTEIDKDGITRKYLKSTKVIATAKKYYNCNDIDGVELEDSTESLHWESRILLGEYMCQIGYELDQVVSEFTLALLEDTGYYIANYYTGGQMQFGKNKGCKFIKNKCVNNYEINPKFENEFFDHVLSPNNRDPSCSSGRQSRGYFGLWIRYNVPKYYQYFNLSYVGGYYYADFCPVSDDFYYDTIDKYFVGRCDIGTEDYGTGIYYSGNKNYTSKELEKVTGETYSMTSFCYLSSLLENGEINKPYSNVTRAICYKTFCSSKSLTVKILNNYIVCPRGGGKINAVGFIGYFLCPDYNLICSGTVLCNNIFDCTKKKSEIKSSSYIYDYDVKTSQNIENAEIDDFDNENNYELTDDGICVKFCKQCNLKKTCIKCRKNYGLVGDKENELVICKAMEEINIGYYLNTSNSIYYKCGANCEKCYNENICNKCKINYGLIINEENKNVICQSLTDLKNGYYLNTTNSIYYKCKEYCKKCISEAICEECDINYGLVGKKGTSETICKLSKNLQLGYYLNKTNNIYYKCSEYCEKCYNDNMCYKCITNYYLVGDKNNELVICKSMEEINKGYYLNTSNSIYYKCGVNCEKCYNDNICNKCIINYGLVGNKENNNTICQNLEYLKNGYYLNETNSIYYQCNKYCKKCNNDKICKECYLNYSLVNKNEEIICKFKEEINIGYYLNDEDSIYYKCDEHCEKCYNNKICYNCEKNFGLVGNKENNNITCLPLEEISIGYYKDNNNLINYKCKDNCEKCLNENNCIKCSLNYAKKDNFNSTCYSIKELRPYYFQDPIDDNNFLKCSDYFNCTMCDEIKCIYNNDEDKKSKTNTVQIIIIILVCFVCVVIIIIIIYCLCKKFKKLENEKNRRSNTSANEHRSEKSEDTLIDNNNEINFQFKTTAGKVTSISIDKNKTMDDLIRKYFQKIGLTKYYGRKDLFNFLKNANKFTFGFQDNVMLHYDNNGINIIVVLDANNLII